MKHLYICLAICLCYMAGACDDNEDNTPSMADDDRLEALIDHSNADIMDFKQKYGTYILYEFDPILDFAYQFEEATAWRSAQLTNLSKEDAPQAVSFLKANFLNCYDEEIIKTYFPRKLLICARIYGSTMGTSYVPTNTYHDAVANLNSMTIACLDKQTLTGMTAERKSDYLRQLHFTLLGGYIINARGHYFVESRFFEYGATLYNSLMDPNRIQAQRLPNEFFYQNGFFRPDDGEATYYGTAEDDLIVFTRELIRMDEERYNELLPYNSLMDKLRIVAGGLRTMGVQVEKINPIITRFL